ncbi:MAG: SDR family NAD(P)-dependent oxidoreductase [Acidimicrobiia bacterium]|nr:SDR family NAD(P)-dependent oxidoreductase [Acidimicrobiia bacterium]
MKRIAERVAVVTGAGSGIGRSVSLELARNGAHLALVDIDERRLVDVMAAVVARGSRASTHVVDVSCRQQMAALPDQVLAEHGSVEILVNNAGVSVNRPFEDQDVDDIEWITGINYWGVMYGCRFFLPHLQRASEAHIVNMSSSAGLTGMKDQGSYAATKFAVRGLSECLYVELAGSTVGITCVHPGAVATDILESARMDPAHKQRMVGMFKYAMPPDKAARRIVRAIEQDRFKLVFCAESRALDHMKRLAPVGTLKLMRFANRRTTNRSSRRPG